MTPLKPVPETSATGAVKSKVLTLIFPVRNHRKKTMIIQDLLTQLEQAASSTTLTERVAVVRCMNPRGIIQSSSSSASDWTDEDEHFREFNQFKEKNTP